ncbi:hypothetical protein PIIN_11335 [Serendipita indica DSM 11827]|uniref:Uncharacterized protein n=1 Tax=Serendipita indica (strain DSM 11827) TaxID=1109443 RepID=G4U1B5_SERID|nr:hypothetical protein PIIN_11335 [Serendipita indica DSM 11827]
MTVNWALGGYGDTRIPTNSTPLAPRDSTLATDLEMISLLSTHLLSKQVCLGLSVWVIYDYFLITDDSVKDHIPRLFLAG